MGTAVLRSHPDPFLHIDSFGSRTPPPPMKPHRRKALRSASSSATASATASVSSPPYPAVQTRLRRSPASLPARAAPPRTAGRRVTFADKENAGAAMVVRFPSHNIVMEKVKILKRGEDPAPPAPAPAAVLRSAAAEAASPPLPSDRRSNGGDVPNLSVDRRSNGGAVSASSPPAVDRRAAASPLFSTTRLGPEPEILPKQIGFSDRCPSGGVSAEFDVSPIISKFMPKQSEFSTPPQAAKNIGLSTAVAYAGPGYVNSPAPSSVPFPALFMNKSDADQAAKRELATRNLRGLLRLGDSP